MFEQIARRPDPGRRIRRAAFVALSAVLQAALVATLVIVGDRFRAAVTGTEPIVAVQFFRAAPTPPAPPPAPSTPRSTPPAVRARRQPVRPAAPAQALVQPKAPAPVPEAPPPEEPADADAPSADREGVVGGVPGAPAPSPGAGSPGSAGEAPTFAKPGYRLPHPADGACLARSLDVSKDLRRSLSGAVTVKFAVLGDGTPAYFQVLTGVPNRRIGEAIWKAVAACQWVPGADASGQPASIWVVVPFRFQSS
jgi:protein TonB